MKIKKQVKASLLFFMKDASTFIAESHALYLEKVRIDLSY